MAILVVCYDNTTGGFKIQKVGSAQITDGAIVSGKVASGAMMLGMIDDWDKQSFVNLLINGDFEIGDPPTAWTAVNSTLAREGTIVKIGNYSLKITATAIGGQAWQEIPDYTRYIGRVMTLGAWLYGRSANTGDGHLRLSGEGVGSVDSVFVTKDDDWHWITVSFTIPVGITGIRSLPRLNTNGDILYVDGAILVEGEVCPAFSPMPVDIESVLSGHIGSGQVGIPHIYPGAVVSAKIGALAVGTPHIANQAVTSAKIGTLAVGTPHIAALAITSGKVASGGLSPLTSGKIWAGFTGNMPREENKPAGDWQVIVDQTLTSNVQVVDITGLDINTDGVYLLFFNHKNTQGSVSDFGVWREGDYTETNYYLQYVTFVDTAITAALVNTSHLGQTPANGGQAMYAQIYRDADGYMHIFSFSDYGRAAALRVTIRFVNSSNTTDNITSLRIYSLIASGLGIGTRIILCKPTT